MKITKREITCRFNNLKGLKKKKIALDKQRKKSAKELKRIEEQYIKTSFLIDIIRTSKLVNGIPVCIERTRTINGWRVEVTSEFFLRSPDGEYHTRIRFNDRSVTIYTNAHTQKHYGILIRCQYASCNMGYYEKCIGINFKNLKEIIEAAKQYIATGKKIDVDSLVRDRKV